MPFEQTADDEDDDDDEDDSEVMLNRCDFATGSNQEGKAGRLTYFFFRSSDQLSKVQGFCNS